MKSSEEKDRSQLADVIAIVPATKDESMNQSYHSTQHTPYHHKRSVLEIPQGVQKMLDVLTDAREPVREVMLEGLLYLYGKPRRERAFHNV